MKKILFALVAVALLTFNSCGGSSDSDNVNNAINRQCWKITTTTTVEGYTVPVTSYVWLSAAEIVLTVEATKAELAKKGYDATVTYEAASASDENSCLKQSNPLDPTQAQCWAITTSYGLVSAVTYLWGPETAAIAARDLARNEAEGATVTYARADANDASSCIALNKQGF